MVVTNSIEESLINKTSLSKSDDEIYITHNQTHILVESSTRFR